MNTIKIFDLLGKKVNLKIDSRNTIKTQFGGILTIIAVITIFVLSWFIGKDIVYHENPISFHQNSINIKTPNITFNRNSFPISISVFSINSEILNDPTYFSIELIYQKWKIENDIYVNQDVFIKLEPCTAKHFPTISNETFFDLALNQVLCPNYHSIDIFGSWSEPEMNRLKIQLKMCDWEKNKDFCKSESEIKKYFNKNSPNLNILYLDLQMNVKNYYSPIEYFPVYIDKFSVPELLKLTYFHVQEQKLYTDDNLVLNDIKEDRFLKLVEQSTDITDIDKENKITNVFFIMSSNKYDSYHRKYIKVPEIIAVVGGLMKSITFIMSLIVKIFSEFEFYNTIINQIFKIENPKNDKIQSFNSLKNLDLINEKDNKKKEYKKNLEINVREKHNNFFKVNQKPNNLSSSIENKNINIIKNNEDNVNEMPNNIDNVINENSPYNLNISISKKRKIETTSEHKSAKNFKNFKFSIKDIMIYLFCRCIRLERNKKKKYQVMDYGIRKINDNLEISKILLNFEEYKIIKKIIFSDEQILYLEDFMKFNPCLNEIRERENIEIFKNVIKSNNQ